MSLTGSKLAQERSVSELLELLNRGGVHAWTYTYSKGSNLQWHEARQWCQNHFVDLVSIQNKEEAEYLNIFLPRSPKYYWIGVQKVAGMWTWVKTNEPVPVEAQRWASEEPDDLAGQDCVELYIKRDKDTAKWNNEKCSKRKEAICYAASCTRESCNAHGDCEETIGNFTCRCHPGFLGLHCEEAVACEVLAERRQSSQLCVHPNGPNRFNSSCRFHCEVGFRLVGVSVLACQADGRWSHPVPQCEVERCPALNQTDFSLNCSHPISPFSYNSTCQFSCDDGYELVGQERVRCDHTGRWSAGTPECSEPSSFGSRCDFTCQEGHDLLGGSSISCLASGEWSSPAPRCAVTLCQTVTPPTHGVLSCSHPNGPFSFASRCSVTCKEGFVVNGTSEVECLSSGRWSAGVPTCRALTCPPLTVVSHGSTLCWDPHERSSFGSRCTTSCEDGFLLNGTADTECSSGGTWTSDVPVCLVKKCSALRSPAHGSLNCSDPHGKFSFASRCSTACDEGFVLNGTADVECSSQETWSTEPPECLAKSCPPVSSPAHGSLVCSDTHGEFSFGSRCTSACEDGFVLNGTEETNCTSSGVWSADIPRCIAQRCPGLPPQYGRMNCSLLDPPFSFGSRCDYDCSEGFRLKGAASVTCDPSGRWSPDVPTCRREPRPHVEPCYVRTMVLISLLWFSAVRCYCCPL
uniref:E-selectin n=1 Tax=Oryzias melastigma TaxID=30732 RepID=A0A3B3D7Q4_ORYME